MTARDFSRLPAVLESLRIEHALMESSGRAGVP